LFYLARTLGGQLDAGEDYQELRASVGLHLLDFDLFDALVLSSQHFDAKTSLMIGLLMIAAEYNVDHPFAVAARAKPTRRAVCCAISQSVSTGVSAVRLCIQCASWIRRCSAKRASSLRRSFN
jgi:hypothetical protein